MAEPTKFQRDLQAGQKGERHVANKLKSHFGAESWSRIGADKGFDFVLKFPSHTLRFEVKTDFKCAETGNLFLEYSCAKKDSGLISTTADKWAILVPHRQLIVVFCPIQMIAFLDSDSKVKTVRGGDRQAVRGKIVKLDYALTQPFIEQVDTNTTITKT